MRIPNGPTGEMTVSASQIRTFGAGGFQLDSQEQSKGCPRLYYVKYVAKALPEAEPSYPLIYGSMMHDVFHRMERDGVTPDEALVAAFPADGSPEMWAEAKADLTKYMERGASPADRYGTLAVEVELDALLFVDDEYGPVHWRGFVDHIGLDMDEPYVLHVTDYKTNRFPPTVSQVEGDVQLKSYAWLAMQCSEQFGIPRDRVKVVVHLDAIKWREIEVQYTAEEIQDWHDWAVAVCRGILRDEEAKPKVNPGCADCPIRYDCPAFEALPDTAREMALGLRRMDDPGQRIQWREAANAVRLLLEKEVKAIDAALQEKAVAEGGLVIGDWEWTVGQEWHDAWDLRALHRALGEAFYGVVNPVKSRIEKVTQDWPASEVSAVRQAVERVPGEVKAKRGRRRNDG